MSRVEDIFELIEILFDIYYAIKNSETVPNRKIFLPSDHNATTNVFVINICNFHEKKPSLVALTLEYVFFSSFIRELDLICIFRNNIIDFSFLSLAAHSFFSRSNHPA